MWEVHTKGNPNSFPYEICVLTSTNEHGKKSYGWEGPEKIPVSTSGGPCHIQVTEWLWDELVGVAQRLADKLNAEERKKDEQARKMAPSEAN